MKKKSKECIFKGVFRSFSDGFLSLSEIFDTL